MPRKGVKIAIQGFYVYFLMYHCLTAIHNDDSPLFVGFFAYRCDVVDRAQYVGALCHRYDLGFVAQQRVKSCHVKLAVVKKRDYADGCSHPFAKELPRNNV